MIWTFVERIRVLVATVQDLRLVTCKVQSGKQFFLQHATSSHLLRRDLPVWFCTEKAQQDMTLRKVKAAAKDTKKDVFFGISASTTRKQCQIGHGRVRVFTYHHIEL